MKKKAILKKNMSARQNWFDGAVVNEQNTLFLLHEADC